MWVVRLKEGCFYEDDIARKLQLMKLFANGYKN